MELRIQILFLFFTCQLFCQTSSFEKLFNEKIDSIENRLLIFDGTKEHATVVQTDKSARYIININFLT